jgi:hypothetical protein
MTPTGQLTFVDGVMVVLCILAIIWIVIKFTGAKR